MSVAIHIHAWTATAAAAKLGSLTAGALLGYAISAISAM